MKGGGGYIEALGGRGANLTIGNARCRLFQKHFPGDFLGPSLFPPLFPPIRSAGKVPSSVSLFSARLACSFSFARSRSGGGGGGQVVGGGGGGRRRIVFVSWV